MNMHARRHKYSMTETEGPHPFSSRGRSLCNLQRIFYTSVISQSHENVILFHGAAYTRIVKVCDCQKPHVS